jgi:agmatine deiminase
MLWPRRTDTWSFGAKPAQKQYAEIARAIARFTPVTIAVNEPDYKNAAAIFDGEENIRVIEMTSDDAWIRDTGATFVVNGKGEVRAVNWHFNAYGGFYDGLYFPWDKDDEIAQKMAGLCDVDCYRPEEFILEGGSIHVDGEGTVITTDMCLLSPGRSASVTDLEPWSEELRAYCDEKLKAYLGVEKVIWVKDGIDPEETNGHIDDVACFVRPGEVIVIDTDDEEYPFYHEAKAAQETLAAATDAKGRQLKVHKLCMPVKPLFMSQEACDTIDIDENAEPRVADEPLIASYLNYLVTNKGVIVPQYGDENDALAIEQLQAVYPDHEVVGVHSWEVVYGGGNIHCITQQQPSAQ